MSKFMELAVTIKSFFSGFAQKCFVSFCITVFAHLFGVDTTIYKTLLVMFSIDIITGLIAVKKEGKAITSWRLFTGTGTKIILYALFLSALVQFDSLVNIPLLDITMLSWGVTILATTELLSITENLSRAGILIPKPLIDKLHKILNTKQFK